MATVKNMIEVKQKVKTACDRDGGRIIYGNLDYKISEEPFAEGNWMEPIITEGIDTYSKSFQDEFFGPVFNLFSAATPKECLDLGNASDYGLAATIFTEDLDLAENYAVKLRVG